MTESRYYPAFDYLRACAAIGVFISHADIGKTFPVKLGDASVQAFFALSGFLIGGILLRSEPSDLPKFFFNRAVRIWVPYAIAIAILAVATAIKQGFGDPKFVEFFFYMVMFVYNWFGPQQLAEFGDRMPLNGTGNHFWSICVEEQFYLFAPFLILFLPRTLLPIGLAGAVSLSPNYFASISAGVLLAWVGPRWTVIALLVAGGLIAKLAGSYIATAALLSAALVGALSHLRGGQAWLGRVAGGASYPFYLNHWIGLFVINSAAKLGFPYWISAIVGFTIPATLSVAHYLLIDRFIAQQRSRWFSRRAGIFLFAYAVISVSVGLTGGFIILSQR